ncbi:MAG: glycoside hydrolase family 76 protein [Solirubrobacteraceae bacterium]
MRPLTRTGRGNFLTAALVLSALLVCSSGDGAAASSRRLTAVQRHYLSLAEHGVKRAAIWRNTSRHWYNKYLHDRRQFPLAPIWDVYPLWESVIDIALADPSRSHRQAVVRFANFAESYWDPKLKPGPAYLPYPVIGRAHAHGKAYFDDNGWWGLAFLDAYTAVGKRRYLRDAEKAFKFIARFGWVQHGGGVWWNNEHPWRSGDAVAETADLSARLYQVTKKRLYLSWAIKLITWANHNILKWDGSYSRAIAHEATTSHAGEGSMLSVLTALCDAHVAVPPAVYAGLPQNSFTPQGTMDKLPYHPDSWCNWAEALAVKTDLGVPSKEYKHVDAMVPLNDNPQTDAVYVRGLLDLYRHDHNHWWYDTAVNSATRILQHSRDRRGLYLRSWSGGHKMRDTDPDMLRTHAASVSVFAMLALVRQFGT